jgi:nuclear polyadenylated RNA-binding protein NAB2
MLMDPSPTGPKSMRNGNHMRGGRDKRMIGHIHKAMDRSSDFALHRVRGQSGTERINSHNRGLPSGPRMGQGRQPRNANTRAASIQAGLANMQNMNGPGGMGVMNNGGWMVPGQQPNQIDLYAMLEQQSRMMQQLSEQMMNGGGAQRGGFGNNQRPGKSLFDRVQDPNRNNNRRGGAHHSNGRPDGNNPEATGEEEDVDMAQPKRDALNPDDTVCKYNLNCTNKDCKFAHQSPAAPAGVTVDVQDICTFGAACKNRKCVGRHPSPAARLAHQGEQDCKFFPNCQNPRCPFKHPSMPLCRNGADCTTANCKFTHVKTKCRFNPCLNPNCRFAHEEGQQGGFKDKVWTSELKDHVSERQFLDGTADEETIITVERMATSQEQPEEIIG